MAAPFPSSTGPEHHPATDPRNKTRGKPSEHGRGLTRTPLVPVALVLIAAGATLIGIVSGSLAGIDSDAIGVVAIVLGAAVFMARVGAGRRSHGSPAG